MRSVLRPKFPTGPALITEALSIDIVADVAGDGIRITAGSIHILRFLRSARACHLAISRESLIVN